METAWQRIGRLKVPALYMYGAHDQIIPKNAAFRAAAQLKPTDRSAYYAKGWHLMMRDKQRSVVWGDTTNTGFSVVWGDAVNVNTAMTAMSADDGDEDLGQ